MQPRLLASTQRPEKMSAAKSRFEKVSLEDLKKILPEQVVNGNENHRSGQKDKKKNKQAETSKPKSRV